MHSLSVSLSRVEVGEVLECESAKGGSGVSPLFMVVGGVWAQKGARGKFWRSKVLEWGEEAGR